MDRVSSLIRKHSGVVITPSIEEAVNNLGSTQRREVIRREGIECYKQGVWRDPHECDVKSSSHAAFPRGCPTDGSQKGNESEARQGRGVGVIFHNRCGWVGRAARTLRVFDLPLLPVTTVSIHTQVPLAIK